MSTADKLSAIIANNEAIIESRDDIAISIANKGVVVPDGTKLNGMATLIDAIEVGSGNSEETTSSKYYLNKCVLTIDDGYQIERIPISAGDVIDLGEGADVEASTNWGEYYHANSHPEMTFQSWASSIDITDNQFVVPDDICTDYHVGAIYVTADGLNHYIEFAQAVGFSHRSDSGSSVIEGSSTATNANQALTACWLGNNVVSIGDSAFRYCYSLASISLPEGVTIISGYAFQNCPSLKLITLPGSITTISLYTFSSCTSLTTLNIPKAITDISVHMFSYCSSLTSIHIPGCVVSVGNYAFYNCLSLITTNIPDSVITIGDFAFYYCYSLISMSIPDSVINLGFSVVDNCFSLVSIKLPNGITTVGSNMFFNCRSLTSIDIPEGVISLMDICNDCYSLKSVEIPESVTYISGYIFKDCWVLTFVNIPEAATTIGYEAFKNCYSLIAIVLNSSTPPTLDGATVFTSCPATFFVPVGSISTYESATNWSAFTGRFIEDTEENRLKFGLSLTN